ncbi:MAG: tRNA (adenosine(37)-N6)-threonylcarbamoyltransferase complex ATPase subunit type 1 TsaE [Spirochaetaceae bacterium]|nr:tRNA (adenosine(37)-N6)-threonylcarbamoyltransferase complex ATPase subunit type 1 TsaE [Spirochaetaceae bacterium]MBP5329565.1 tRNA (adenosine(37)-N6)-threonylcarbamoyltransferase complex ATPase subunit type 1 TsaE [Spirochaetaceae bacterium]
MSFNTKTAEETIELGKKIGKFLKKGDCIALEGTLAAGKTTITKGIAEALGITENVSSPTFTIVSEYDGNLHLYHIDAYRLDSAEDFLDLGAEEMLYGSGVCVIEWSEKVREVLPKKTITISLSAQKDDGRLITIENWPYEWKN